MSFSIAVLLIIMIAYKIMCECLVLGKGGQRTQTYAPAEAGHLYILV